METANASNIKVLDLDTLLPGKKVVRISGQEFDVTELPLGLAMKMVKIQGELQTGGVETQLDTIVSIIVDVLKATDPNITEEWVLSSIGVQKMTALVNFIVEDITATVNEDTVEPVGEIKGDQSPAVPAEEVS